MDNLPLPEDDDDDDEEEEEEEEEEALPSILLSSSSRRLKAPGPASSNVPLVRVSTSLSDMPSSE